MSAGTCPKCAQPFSADATECAHCGVVFAKLVARPAVAEPAVVVPSPRGAADPVQRAILAARVLMLAGLVVWTWQFARVPMGVAAQHSVLHVPDLVFHEAGHVLFSPFGRFMTVLGGSLFQFLVPVILAAAFLKQRDAFGAAVCTWWAGQNLLDLAPYIADARALQLVLLGGQTGAEVQGHDWEYLLAALGWMRFDRAIGSGAHWLGLAMMIAALVWAGITAAARRA